MLNIKLVIKYVNDFLIKPLTYSITQKRLDVHPLQHLEPLHLTDQVLIQWSDMTTFGQTTKYINHPKLMSNLHITETKDKFK